MIKLTNGLLAAAALVMVADSALAQRKEGDRPRDEQRDGDRPRAERDERGDRDGDRPRGERGPRDGEGPRGERGPRGGEGRPGGPFGFHPIMAALDSDHDGVISAEEIDQAVAVLRKLDRNKDGQLTREEIGPMGPPEGRGFGGPPREGERGGRGGFGGGGGGGRGGFGPEQMVARIMEADTDGDGKISKEEAPERMQRGFTESDTNDDGLLDKAEVEAMASRIRDRMREGGFGRGGQGGGAGRGDREGRRPGRENADGGRRRPEPDDE